VAEGNPKKRVTTAPLTPQEIESALLEIPEDEFIEQFDEIFSRDSMPETLEELISLDDYMDRELREMFQSIVAQYLRPVEFAVTRVREGDQSRKTAVEGLEALAPIISASDTLEYDDIGALLREIERPLRDLESGAKRKLGKREVESLSKAWGRLVALVRPGVPEREVESGPSVSLSALTRYIAGINATDVRKLRAAGLASLHDLAGAQATEVAQVSGIAQEKAERICAFAAGAVVAATAPRGIVRRPQPGVPAGWMRVSIDSDVFKGRLTFEYSTLGRYLEPILSRLSEADGSAVVASRPAVKKSTRRKKTTDALGSASQ
jgi:hypothetical protein